MKPKGNFAYLIRIKPEHKVQDAIVFAPCKADIEKMQQTPCPHYVGFDWSWVQKVERVSRKEMLRLLASEEAGLADI